MKNEKKSKLLLPYERPTIEVHEMEIENVLLSTSGGGNGSASPLPDHPLDVDE